MVIDNNNNNRAIDLTSSVFQWSKSTKVQSQVESYQRLKNGT